MKLSQYQAQKLRCQALLAEYQAKLDREEASRRVAIGRLGLLLEEIRRRSRGNKD